MAQRVQVLLTDDLDGTNLPAGKGETIQFGLDGARYEIDLSAKNATAIRKVLAPYVDAGRIVKGARSRRERTMVGSDTRTIKAWAHANGYEVKERGRVSNEVRAAFEAAN